MTEERRQRIEELFAELCDLAPGQWEVRLEETCRADPVLKSEVLSLLREDRSTAGFMSTRDAGPEVRLAELVRQMPSEASPREIGGYKILGVLGRGSMGVVYEAEQARPHRRVALKVCAAGLVSERDRRLFEREAEILGRLHHPGIAQIHEWGLVGSEAGSQPYLVLELVDGKPLVGWADERGLDLVARLELFMRVCAGVQHAHQQGVLHRDLKPSNILVADSGQPKILDFGIARSLNADTLQTQEGAAVIGTLAYMSPEQAEGKTDELDTRTDIHALGVILHELLTGRLPYEVKGKPIHVALRILIGDEPRRLHEHAPSLRGDLDHIVAKALEKDPDRRYSSAQTLAEDIGRYLRGEPILARPGTTVYQLQKWVGRHRALAGGIAATLATLIAGLVVALILKSQSDQNAVRAEDNARVAKENEQRALAGETLARSEKERAEANETRAIEGERKAIERAEEVLRLSDLQDLDDLVAKADRLWPAHPENVPKYEDWLREAEKLVAGLPAHEETLARLRAKAQPWTTEMHPQHPRFAELQNTRRHIAHLRELQAVLDSGKVPEDPVPEEVGVDWSSLPTDANGLHDLAWPLVDPDRDGWGGEKKGLVLARKAVELAAPAERALMRDTLAWALFAAGRFDEALAEEEQALREGGPKRRKDLEGYLDRLQKAIEKRIGPEGLEEETKHLAELESQRTELQAELSKRPEWLFADAQDKWWHDQLEELVDGLKAFTDEKTGLLSSGVSREHGWGMRRRLEFASTVEERSVSGSDSSARWSEALASIADPTESPSYGGFGLAPQLGLLPIGRDPQSGLWEFAHLQTGEPAQRRVDGRLILREQTGLVFVLLPGGMFTKGAQQSDPAGPNYDPEARPEEDPPSEARVTPFFLSKYEMTQSQWLRFMGVNPSLDNPQTYHPSWNSAGMPGDLLHPVEQVSWNDCALLLERLGLELPRKTQWEYGARAGTTTVWWCDMESIVKAGNLADRHARNHAGGGWGAWEDWDDGNSSHARVGSYLPNAFGLHDVIGNVWEWCQDPYSPGSPLRVYRGGSFRDLAGLARSALRGVNTPSVAVDSIGLRPARAVHAP